MSFPPIKNIRIDEAFLTEIVETVKKRGKLHIMSTAMFQGTADRIAKHLRVATERRLIHLADDNHFYPGPRNG